MTAKSKEAQKLSLAKTSNTRSEIMKHPCTNISEDRIKTNLDPAHLIWFMVHWSGNLEIYHSKRILDWVEWLGFL